MTDFQPKISIIVPVYNTEKYLRQCLDSLVNQTLNEIEIICVNDGSSDHSDIILEEYLAKDDRVKAISKENGGLSSARNTGIKVSTGKYIMFVDSDDWLDTNMCEQMLSFTEGNHADCSMCAYTKEFGDHAVQTHIFNGNQIFESSEVKTRFHRRLFGLLGEETAHPEEADLIVSACMQLFIRERVFDIGFVDTKKIGTEDCLYQIMVYQRCSKYAYLDKPFYHYRRTNESSLTMVYKPKLYESWQNLYDMMNEIITEFDYPDEYKTALNNRIILGIISLGLNEISAKQKCLTEKAKRIKQIIDSERYQTAFQIFDLSYLPLKWKVFFMLCKYKMTIVLVIVLHLIEFLRMRV
jgi:glycosyltransferase EpsH